MKNSDQKNICFSTQCRFLHISLSMYDHLAIGGFLHLDCWNFNSLFKINFGGNFLKNGIFIWETGVQCFNSLHPEWNENSLTQNCLAYSWSSNKEYDIGTSQTTVRFEEPEIFLGTN